MPEEKPEATAENPPAPPAGEEVPSGEKPDDKGGAGAESTSEEDALPDWARKELAKVRGEAAGYRTRLRDAETKLSGAKTPEEVEAALADVKAKNAELEHSLVVATVARKFDLPEALAGRLRGATSEELEADAKALQSLLTPVPPPALGGGLDPSDEDDGEMDPRKLARRTRRF